MRGFGFRETRGQHLEDLPLFNRSGNGLSDDPRYACQKVPANFLDDGMIRARWI